MADGTRAAQEAKELEETLWLMRESTDRNSKDIGEIKNALGELEELKDLVAAISMKYDQVAGHVYGKHQQQQTSSPHHQEPPNQHHREPPTRHHDSPGTTQLGFHTFGENLHRNDQQFHEIPHRNDYQFHPQGHAHNLFNPRVAKIEFPRFYGENPTGWLYKCERFFEFTVIENIDKVKLASLHLDDSSLKWFQWFERCHQHLNWGTFKQGLISRFGPNSYEDAMGDLTKLRQTSTVKAYQEQFEILANKTQNLPETFFISCCISGLKEEIQPGVLMFRPTSITQAIGLAKLQEASIEAITRKSKMGHKPESTGSFYSTKPQFNNGGYVRKELSKELEEKRAKGLCFKCGEKYSRGHMCKKKELFAMEGEDEEQQPNEEEEVDDESAEQVPEAELQISLNALTGSISYRTMRVRRSSCKLHLMCGHHGHKLPLVASDAET